MKIYQVLFLSIVFLLGCSTKKESIEGPEEISNSKHNVSSTSMADLINIYPAIDFDTLWVYSTYEFEETSKTKFKGFLIDSAYYKFFPEEVRDFFYSEPEVYACYRIDVDSNHVGLITRTPSEYVPSSIKLFVVNRHSNSIVESFELADSWGDAGDSMTKDSWLYRNKDNQLEWLFYRQDCSYETEEAEEPVCVDSLAVFKTRNGIVTEVPIAKEGLINLKRELLKNESH